MLVKNKTLALSLALAGAVWLISLPALAEDYASKGAAMEKMDHWSIQEMDKDGDGKLSAEEFQRGEKYFAQLDGNGDGYITEEELKKQSMKGRYRGESGAY